MNIAFAGFRHDHGFGLYKMAKNSSEVEVVGCFEEDAFARAKAEERNIVFNYDKYEDVLNDEKVDIVAIADYYGKRGSMAIAALESGKHVICDKPICTDLAELEKIKQLAKKKNLKVCCMLDLRYMSQVDAAKEIIQSGKIGLLHIVSFTGQHCLNYGKRPSWYFEDGKHGGTINDIAIHGLDVVRYITGKNLTEVSYVRTWNAFADKEPDFKDCAQFMAVMDGMRVMADISYSAPVCNGTLPTYWDFYFWGTEGMMKFNLKEKCIYLYKGEEQIIECEACTTNCLSDFIGEIQGQKTKVETFDILESQKQVLEIQNVADRN